MGDWRRLHDGGGVARLDTVVINDLRPRTITYKTDMSGQVFHRQEVDNLTTQQDPQEVWYRFGGKQTGYAGNNGTSDKDYMASIADRQATAGPCRAFCA